MKSNWLLNDSILLHVTLFNKDLAFQRPQYFALYPFSYGHEHHLGQHCDTTYVLSDDPSGSGSPAKVTPASTHGSPLAAGPQWSSHTHQVLTTSSFGTQTMSLALFIRQEHTQSAHFIAAVVVCTSHTSPSAVKSQRFSTHTCSPSTYSRCSVNWTP